jgi:hypothetical protein
MDIALNTCRTENFARNENQILLAARMTRDHYYPGRDRNFPDWILVFAVFKLLELDGNASPDRLFELLKDHSQIESPEMRRYLHLAIAAGRSRDLARRRDEGCVFSGGRKFSFEKTSGMSASLTSRCQTVGRSKLNQLLFYSDFVHYFLYGGSISGARYVRHRFGPVFEGFEKTFDEMLAANAVAIEYRSCGEETIISSSDEVIVENLSMLDVTTLTWVAATFGGMSEVGIQEFLSHECAYRFTRRGDYIAYEYARIFQKLPEPLPEEPPAHDH